VEETGRLDDTVDDEDELNLAVPISKARNPTHDAGKPQPPEEMEEVELNLTAPISMAPKLSIDLLSNTLINTDNVPFSIDNYVFSFCRKEM
jgi:hypothetical protein